MTRIYNWLIKQLFYLRFLILKQDSISVFIKFPSENIWEILKNKSKKIDYTFYSKSFTDGQWCDKLPWWDVQKWNTIDYNSYGIFSQQYGKFYFKTKLGEYVIRQPYFSDIWPAIWLYDSRSQSDTELGLADHPYYYEIDIELFKKHFGITVQFNHNGPQEGATVLRAMFGNHKLYQNLQKDFHLFLIDWDKEWIKFSINGIKCAQFRNSIHVPMQIIISKTNINKVIVKN